PFDDPGDRGRAARRGGTREQGTAADRHHRDGERRRPSARRGPERLRRAARSDGGARVTLADVNVLVYAHREDSPHHAECHAWLLQTLKSDQPFGLSQAVLASVIR